MSDEQGFSYRGRWTMNGRRNVAGLSGWDMAACRLRVITVARGSHTHATAHYNTPPLTRLRNNARCHAPRSLPCAADCACWQAFPTYLAHPPPSLKYAPPAHACRTLRQRLSLPSVNTHVLNKQHALDMTLAAQTTRDCTGWNHTDLHGILYLGTFPFRQFMASFSHSNLSFHTSKTTSTTLWLLPWYHHFLQPSFTYTMQHYLDDCLCGLGTPLVFTTACPYHSA